MQHERLPTGMSPVGDFDFDGCELAPQGLSPSSPMPFEGIGACSPMAPVGSAHNDDDDVVCTAAKSSNTGAISIRAQACRALRRGIENLEWAKSNSSMCKVCHSRIDKGTPRFSWFWHTARPNGFIHHLCVVGTGLSRDVVLADLARIAAPSGALCDALQQAEDPNNRNSYK